MIKIDINTGLDRYLQIDAITNTDGTGIRGRAFYDNAPAYTGIESLAQLCSMHVRMLHDFKKHSALAIINDITIINSEYLNGYYSISGKQTARSGRAFTYSLESSIEGDIKIKGSIIITLVDYDDKFQLDILQEHYKKLYSCLSKK